MRAAPGLTAVIPALNAAATLPRTLASLSCAAEIIVVDGASNDSTRDVAEQFGARWLAAPRGRGSQIAAGVAEAHCEWLLIIHADTTLVPGWEQRARLHMAHCPGKAGYFRFALDSAEPVARRLERRVAWRCRVLALPYGDQALLIHRDLLQNVGGIRCLPLMEDVDLIRRLGRRRLVMLDAVAVTSAVRWEREGWRRRSARNLLCLGLWFAGVPAHRIASLYR